MVGWSYWERKIYFDQLDVVIVGAGFVGLSVGISLLEKNPQQKVLIIERGFIPHGASTRNAGFACFGSAGELADDLSKRSAEEVFGLFAKRYAGIRKLLQRTGPSEIEFRPGGGYELFYPEEESLISHETLKQLNEGIEAYTGLKNYFFEPPESLIKSSWPSFGKMLCNDHEACIHPLKTLQLLTKMFQQAGGQILYGFELSTWKEMEDGVMMVRPDGLEFMTQQLMFCVNGFAKRYFPDIMVKAARNSVMILQTDRAKELNGCYHVDRGYLYFRAIDAHHILLGGGRHWDLEGEYQDNFLMNPMIRNKLIEFAEQYILNGQSYTITDEWTGIMGLGPVKSPIVQMVSSRVGVAVRMGGMGVALASLTGEEAAELLYQNQRKLRF